MALRSVTRAAAWLVLAVIVVLSLVPPAARPTTAVPHDFEHAGIFLLDGIAFGMAYLGFQRRLIIGAVAFSGGIELAQLMVPGRHSRISDFVVDAAAACIGIVASAFLDRKTRRWTQGVGNGSRSETNTVQQNVAPRSQ
jgi:VanZ family protein